MKNLTRGGSRDVDISRSTLDDTSVFNKNKSESKRNQKDILDQMFLKAENADDDQMLKGIEVGGENEQSQNLENQNYPEDLSHINP